MRLLLHRAGDDRADLACQSVDASLAIGMNAVAEEDIEQVELRIDPQHRPRESAMSKGTVAQPLSTIARVAGPHVPAIASPPAAGHPARLDHHRHGFVL